MFRKKLFSIKNVLDHIFLKIINFLNHFLYNPSYSESRRFKRVRLRAIFSQLEKFRIESFRTCDVSEDVSNALDSEPFFHNSKNFESKVLERVMFRKKKVLHRIRFWSGIDVYKNRFCRNFCFQKTLFGSSYTTKTPTFVVMRFLKTHQLVKKKEEKTVLLSRRLKRIRLWNNFFTTRQILNQDYHNLSDFSSTLQNLFFFKSVFSQRVRLWIKLFTSSWFLNWNSTQRQNLNRNFYSASDFDEKTVFKNSLSKNHLVGQYTP